VVELQDRHPACLHNPLVKSQHFCRVHGEFESKDVTFKFLMKFMVSMRATGCRERFAAVLEMPPAIQVQIVRIVKNVKEVNSVAE